MAAQQKPYFELILDPRLELISNEPRALLQVDRLGANNFATCGPTIICENDSNRPGPKLCILLAWFTAQKRHIMKFVQLYLGLGFDVLLGTTPAVYACKPKSGAKESARMTLKFLRNNVHYGKIVIHGFSAGAVWWGQTLRYIHRDPNLYGFLFEKIKGQVWDSPFTDRHHLPHGASSIAFPNNPAVQRCVEAYLRLHVLKLPGSEFYEHVFHAFKHLNFPVPYLLYTSEDDTISRCSTVADCAEQWKINGNAVYWKIWTSSGHVLHMKEHPEEYRALLLSFLKNIGVCEISVSKL